MKHALRNMGGMFAGLVAAVVIIGVIEAISSVVYPFPKDVDMQDAEAMKAHIATLPAGAFLFVLGAYFAGTLVGTWITARLNRGRQRVPGIAVGCLLFAAAVLNLISIPHPGWFMLACLPVFPMAMASGMRLARPAVSPPTPA